MNLAIFQLDLLPVSAQPINNLSQDYRESILDRPISKRPKTNKIIINSARIIFIKMYTL